MPRTPSNAARRKLLGDVNNFPARSRMQLLHQCLPLSRVLGSLHRVRPQRPSPRLGLRLAYRLHLSPILVGQRTALPDEYVPAGQTSLRVTSFMLAMFAVALWASAAAHVGLAREAASAPIHSDAGR